MSWRRPGVNGRRGPNPEHQPRRSDLEHISSPVLPRLRVEGSGREGRSSARTPCSLPHRSCVVATDDLDRRCCFRHRLTVVPPPERIGLSLPRTGAGSAACSMIPRRCGWIASRLEGVSRVGELSGVALECRNPALLADFYSELTGWPVGYRDPDWCSVGQSEKASLHLSFQRAPSHEPPTWPDPVSLCRFTSTFGATTSMRPSGPC